MTKMSSPVILCVRHLSPLWIYYSYDITLGKKPCKWELGWGYSFLVSNLLDFVSKFEILVKVLALETRVGSAPVILIQVFKLSDVTREESTAKWRVGDNGNTKFSARLEKIVLFNVERPRTGGGLISIEWLRWDGMKYYKWSLPVLHLHSSNRVNFVSATKCLRGALWQSKILDLALLYQLCHGSNGSFNWSKVGLTVNRRARRVSIELIHNMTYTLGSIRWQ